MDCTNPEAKEFTNKVMQKLLTRMNPNLLKERFRNADKYFRPNNHGDKKKLIQQHQEMYKDSEKILRLTGAAINMVPSDRISKKGLNNSTLGKREAALPIPIKKLELGTVHRGQVLRGVLIVKPCAMQGVHSLLQDRDGDVVTVSFYSDVIQQAPNFTSKWREAHRMFPKNLEVEIFEPFFKQAMDNTYVVRVDNMTDVNTEPFTQWFTAVELNEEGKKYVAATQFEEAQASYTEGTKLILNSQSLYTILFQNLALVHLNLNQNTTALQYAVGAILFSPNSSLKAYFRAALALEKLQCFELAQECCHIALKQNQSATKDPLFKALHSRLKSKDLIPQKSQKSSIWNDKQMIKCLASNPVLSDEIPIQELEEDHDTLKKQGNDCMFEKQYDKARVLYEKAIYQLEKSQKLPLATLLTNISFCCFKVGKYFDTMVHASVAICLDPINKKAHYRRISSLLNLELIEDAETCFEYSSLLLKDESKCLMPLKSRFVMENKPTVKHQQMPQAYDEYKPAYAPYQKVEMLNTMMEFSGMGGVCLRDVPPFHIRYPQVKNWPKACQASGCRELLNQTYTLSRSDMYRFMLQNAPSKLVTDEYLMKRLGTNCKSQVKWLYNSNPGDVRFRERLTYGNGRVHHSYGNVAQHPQVMTKGTTHVSIGFADLQELLLCKMVEKMPGAVPLPDHEDTFKWIGYDQSPYVVAKTLVIIEMMKNKKISAKSIVQVWYSAAWSYQTVKDLRNALTIVLSVFQNQKHPNKLLVQKYLTHWQQHDVSLQESREEWMKNHDESWSDAILNWKKESDQFAICTYAMTGQLDYSDISVGSIVMFALPQGEQVAKNENVFQVVNLKDLLTYYEESTHSCGDCVQALTYFLESKVSLLMNKIQSNEIQLKVYCVQICKGNSTLINDICYHHRPYSMSWSNLCDYIHPHEFHDIAKKCSRENETIHFGYSMNWPLETKGAFIGDFVLGEETQSMKDFIRRSLEESEKMVQVMWNYVSYAKKYLTFPTFTNPLNLIDCQMRLGQKLHNKWLSEFISAANGKMTKQQLELVDFSPLFHFNHRTHSIVAFHFTYDPEVNMMSQAP